MIAIPNMEKPKNAFNCSVKINPEERRCIYTGKVFEETLSLLIDRPCDDCPLIEIVRCEECIWKEECTITELWGGRGFCPSGERRTDENN